MPAANVGAWKRFTLALDDRAGRFRFRRARYGLGHIVASRLAKLSGARAWQKRLLVQRNEIDNRHLQ